MAVDALDPGPNGDYPYFPRDAQGAPLTDHAKAKAEGKGSYMPTGVHTEADAYGNLRRLDLTPRKPDGTPIVPPTIPPA